MTTMICVWMYYVLGIPLLTGSNPFACSAASHSIAAFKWERERNIFEIVTKLLGIFQRGKILSKGLMCFCVDTFYYYFGGFNFHGHFCVRSVRSVCFVCVWLLALFRRYLRSSFISLLGNLSPPDIFKLHEKKEKREPQLKVSKCVCVRLSAR